jgi:methylated-DNA-protein-cysteine methyltransferase-like protein
MSTPSSESEYALCEAVYKIVRTIERGKVATYGQIADLIGIASARQVGYAMAQAPPNVPWQRVVGAGGRLTTGKRNPELQVRQRRLLEEEGVAFLPTTETDTVDIKRFGWNPVAPDQQSLFD